MKVTVDDASCHGHGRCYVLAPGLFEPDEEGYNAAKGQSAEIPDDQADAARTAVISCPEHAISLVED